VSYDTLLLKNAHYPPQEMTVKTGMHLPSGEVTC